MALLLAQRPRRGRRNKRRRKKIVRRCGKRGCTIICMRHLFFLMSWIRERVLFSEQNLDNGNNGWVFYMGWARERLKERFLWNFICLFRRVCTQRGGTCHCFLVPESAIAGEERHYLLLDVNRHDAGQSQYSNSFIRSTLLPTVVS